MVCSELKIVEMYRIVLLVVSSWLVVGCAENTTKSVTLPYYNEPNFTPIFIEKEEEINRKVFHKISDFSFYNEDSIIVTQKNIEGKIHVANFVFTSCGMICPNMVKNMKVLSDSLKLGSDVVLLSYSVMPWVDSPSVLKKYKEKNNIHNKNWHFLTGDKGKIYFHARRSYFAEEDIGYSKDSSEFLHTEHFILVDKSKRIRGIYNGTLLLEMQHLINDIKTLSLE